MSATQILPATLDVSRTPRVPLSRLVRVELRKMVDTRAGMWLMIAMVSIPLIAMPIFGFAASDGNKTFENFMNFAAIPQGFLLPVLGILLVTQEWSQRTAMVTFTQEPQRSRVLAAKVYAALTIGAAAIVIAFVIAALATLVFGHGHGFDHTSGIDFVKFGMLEVLIILQGLAYGLLFLNSGAAIVLYFVIPQAVGILTHTVSALHSAGPWIDFGQAQQLLSNAGGLSGKSWAQIFVTATAWVVLPFVIGLWRVRRAELK